MPQHISFNKPSDSRAEAQLYITAWARESFGYLWAIDLRFWEPKAEAHKTPFAKYVVQMTHSQKHRYICHLLRKGFLIY